MKNQKKKHLIIFIILFFLIISIILYNAYLINPDRFMDMTLSALKRDRLVFFYYLLIKESLIKYFNIFFLNFEYSSFNVFIMIIMIMVLLLLFKKK
jgi:hypothetical protein